MVGRGTLTKVAGVGWTVLAYLLATWSEAVLAARFPGVREAVSGGVFLGAWVVVWLAGLVGFLWLEAGEWRDLAREGGFEPTERWSALSFLWARRPALRKTVRGRTVTVDPEIRSGDGSSNRAYTAISTPVEADTDLALDLGLVREPPFEAFDFDLGGDLEVGDPEFDEAFQVIPGGTAAVAGDLVSDDALAAADIDDADPRVDPETVRAVLTPEVRSTLVALREGSFEVTPSAVEHRVEGKLLDPDRVQQHAEATVRLAEAVEAAAEAS